MKTYTFTVKDTNEDVHTFSSEQRVLDVWDRRHKQYPGRPECDAIHYSFFEQLTRQVSPQIESALGKIVVKTFLDLTFIDQHFLKQENCFYMYVYLRGKVTSDSLWVKCLRKYDPQELCQPIEALAFQLCDDEEYRTCAVRRFGYTHKVVGVASLKQSFALQSQMCTTDIPDSEYPDVVLRVRLRKRVNEALRQQVYEEVVAFVQAWNDQADEYSHIHDAQLYGGSPDRYTVCIVMDFGNCDPVALEQLYHYLLSNNEGIKEITI